MKKLYGVPRDFPTASGEGCDDDRCPVCDGSFTEAFMDGRPVAGCICDLRDAEYVVESRVGMEAPL